MKAQKTLSEKRGADQLFDAALPDGARHRFTRPHHPQTNGKVERYNRTLGAEFAYARPWTSETQRADYLQRWLIHYNYHRAHTAIGNQPPATLGPDHCHQRHDAEQLGGHWHQSRRRPVKRLGREVVGHRTRTGSSLAGVRQ